jgi:hypothetical protein
MEATGRLNNKEIFSNPTPKNESLAEIGNELKFEGCSGFVCGR